MTGVAHSLFPTILVSDTDGILVPSCATALIAIGAAVAVPAWRRTAPIAIGSSCAVIAWQAAVQISTSDGDPQMPWIGSLLVLGGAYVTVLQPLAEFQREQEARPNRRHHLAAVFPMCHSAPPTT